MARAKEREAEFQARKAQEAVLLQNGVQAPTGKVTVRGEVLSVKGKDTQFGFQVKMLVQSDEGLKVWVSVPRALEQKSWYDNDAQSWKEQRGVAAGDKVEFTATLTPSNDDALFAFGKRPTKSKIIEFVSTGTV